MSVNIFIKTDKGKSLIIFMFVDNSIISSWNKDKWEMEKNE